MSWPELLRQQISQLGPPSRTRLSVLAVRLALAYPTLQIEAIKPNPFKLGWDVTWRST